MLNLAIVAQHMRYTYVEPIEPVRLNITKDYQLSDPVKCRSIETFYVKLPLNS